MTDGDKLEIISRSLGNILQLIKVQENLQADEVWDYLQAIAQLQQYFATLAPYYDQLCCEMYNAKEAMADVRPELEMMKNACDQLRVYPLCTILDS